MNLHHFLKNIIITVPYWISISMKSDAGGPSTPEHCAKHFRAKGHYKDVCSGLKFLGFGWESEAVRQRDCIDEVLIQAVRGEGEEVMSRRLPFPPHTRGFLFILLYVYSVSVQTVYKHYSYSVQLTSYLLASISVHNCSKATPRYPV